MKVAVHNITGKETSKKVNLRNDVFGVEPNDHAIYLDVKQYLAAKRSGTHKAKERSDVKGSRRKLTFLEVSFPVILCTDTFIISLLLCMNF